MPFQKGQSGNKLGFSSKQRSLYKRFYKDAFEKWKECGTKALDEMAETNPTAFCQLFAGMLPKSFDISQEVNVTEVKTLTIDAALIELGKIAGKLGHQIQIDIPHHRVIEHDEVKQNQGESGK